MIARRRGPRSASDSPESITFMSTTPSDPHTTTSLHGFAPSGAVAPPGVAMYRFSVDSFRITDTRAWHEDTDYVSVSLAVGNRPPLTQTRRIGDVNNVTHRVGIAFQVPVADTETAVLTYAIVNNGHGKPGDVEKGLETAARRLAQKGAQAAATAAGAAIGELLGASIGTAVVPVIGTALGAVAGWLVGSVGHLLFANCDGPVAAGVHPLTGAQLRAAPGGVITHEDNNPGVDSPHGCGGNSHYYVTWSVHRD
jgi:hypothetical protein